MNEKVKEKGKRKKGGKKDERTDVMENGEERKRK